MKIANTPGLRIALLVVIGLIAVLATTDISKVAFIEYRVRIRDPGIIRDYLNAHQIRKLQLGAGGNEPAGWLNTDIEPVGNVVYLDATKGFPFAEGSFHYVFSEHVIEHIPWHGAMAMLQECHRILRSGGRIRIVTPNLTKFVRLLEDETDPQTQAFIESKLRLHSWPDTPIRGAYIFNRQVRDWGHIFLYDPRTLRKSLELAGFKQIAEYRVNDKTDPVFREAESRLAIPDRDLRVVDTWEAMAFEAVR